MVDVINKQNDSAFSSEGGDQPESIEATDCSGLTSIKLHSRLEMVC